MLNGVSELLMLKTDVLNTFETIKVCTAYKLKSGEVVEDMPYDLDDIAEPVYVELKGWNCDITKMKSYDDFPEELNEYIRFVEEKTSVEVTVVSVGPDRTETIIKG